MALFPSYSPEQEVDRAAGGGAEGLRDETAGRAGGDGPRQEAKGVQSHPLSGPRWVRVRVSTRPSVDAHRALNAFSLPHPGAFDECDTEADVLRWSRHDVFLLYDMGIFTALLELLSMEIE